MDARCRNLARTIEKFGVEVSFEQIASVLKAMISWLESVWKTDRDVTHQDQIRFIIKTVTRGTVDMREEMVSHISSAYVSALFDVPPYLSPDAHTVLQELRDLGKQIGLICNTGLTPGFGLRRFLEREGVAKHFDFMLFSDEIGIRKPNPKIFQIAAQKWRFKPCEIVHVGDNLKTDVWGAKNAGFKAVYVASEVGRDRIAESDPKSLVSISRRLDGLEKRQIIPDVTIDSLALTIEAVEEIEKREINKG